MKFRHYYASNKFEEYDCPQPCPEKLATHQLTRAMVDHLLEWFACGPPPYVLFVPNTIMHEAHTWAFPTTLLTILPKNEEAGDVSAIATADLIIYDTIVFIHARRCLPAFSFTGNFREWHDKTFPERGKSKC